MRLVPLSLFLLLLGGCFDPQLGDKPFRCAADEDKQCPDGYTCQNYICVAEGVTDAALPAVEHKILTDAELMPSKEGLVFIDGAATGLDYAGCDDRDTEPNNNAKDATPITGSGTIPGWEICPAGDVDQFTIELAEGQSLEVTVIFKNEQGDLDAAIFDPEGYLVFAARTESNNETLKVAKATLSGKYVLGVYGFGPLVNTYSLKVSIE